MNQTAIKVRMKQDRSVQVLVTPGHFATNHSHVNYYVDLTDIKVTQGIAKKVAAQLSVNYLMSSIDTILCLEGTEMVGAFLAEAMTQPNSMSLSSGADIYVMSPELNANNQMIFRENTFDLVHNKRILFLTSTISTGKTLNRMLECLNYYEGVLVGIAALFSIMPEYEGHAIHSVFTVDDIPDYRSYSPAECTMCAARQKIDAIANSYGYSKLG